MTDPGTRHYDAADDSDNTTAPLRDLPSYYQYMRVRPTDITQEIWDDPNYDIHIAADGCVYLEIRHGTYRLKEAGIIAYNQLVKKLEPHGYSPAPFTPGLWRHRTNNIHAMRR